VSAATWRPHPLGPHTLVAGVGNLFLSDDGFGPEVARQLGRHDLPPGVQVTDYGIRGTHLAYDLLAGWDALVLIDTIPSRGAAGSIHVLEVAADDADGRAFDRSSFDPHGMDPESMLAAVRSLGGTPPPTVVVGCEPARLDEGIGLSPEVAGAVPRAVTTVLELLDASPAARSGPERGEDRHVSRHSRTGD
jgi:hydrogenase maturation protease